MTEDKNTKKNKTESFPCEGNSCLQLPSKDSREEEEEDENAYWENMRIQDEMDEMNDRDREMDEMMERIERIEREEEKKERVKERNKRNQEKSAGLEELRKNLTFVERVDGKLELVKRDDCNPQMNIHIHKVN